MSIPEVIATIIGSLGLGLGILNYLHQWDMSRPKIKVRLRMTTIVDPDTMEREPNIGVIEICNVGHVPVVGGTIGLFSKRRGRWCRGTFAYKSINGVEWSGGHVLEPGRFARLRFETDLREQKGQKLGRVFAETMVGTVFKARRREMRKFVERQKHRR